MTSRPEASALPAPATALVGRDDDVALLGRHLLQPDVRFLTLTGTAGTGKTRLALAVAATVGDRFRDGLCFVDLAPISDPRSVVPAIAHALHVDDRSSAGLDDALERHLADRDVLVVLDNFEHLMEAARTVGDLVARSPGLKILATSRVPLRLRWEHEFAVPPLPLPDLGEPLDVDRLAANPAVALFVQRARAVQPRLELSEQNAGAVAELCVRLDGLPLAIELAAARTKLMAPEAMLGRLGQRLALLSGGPVDAPTRHQTLRTAIDWSYDLLQPKERRLFRRMAIFKGGCTLEAAEPVCAAEEDRADDLLDGVSVLVDHSLLRRDEAAADARFGMLETIREYGLTRLEDEDDAEQIRERHALYFVEKVAEIEPHLARSEQGRWLAYLERDHDNLIAALTWLDERGRAHDALRLAGSLWRFWDARGYRSEGAEWLGRTLAKSEQVTDQSRARALNGAGNLARGRGDYASARALHEQSLALSRRLADCQAIATSLSNLGNIHGDQGDYENARELYGQSLDLRRELGDTRGIAMQLVKLGILAHNAADYGHARALYEEALVLFRGIDDAAGASMSLFQLSETLIALGEGDLASALCDESLRIRATLGDNWGIGCCLRVLGQIAQHQGDVHRSEELFQQSLALFRRQEDAWNIAFLLTRLGEVAHARGNRERSATLLGAAAALAESTGVTVPPAERAAAERAAASARAVLGQAAFATAWSTGRSMRLDDAVALGLSRAPGRPLTPREREVASLVAGGLTNRQIGVELVISERTVDRHLENILAKLGVHSRAEIAAWLERQGPDA